MKHKFLKADIFPVKIKFEDEYDLSRIYYANAKLLENNILIYTSYRELLDEEESGIPVQEISIQFISKKGSMYNYHIYSSTDYELSSLQIDRIIIDAVEELNACYDDDDEIIKFMTGNMHSGGIEYSDRMNTLSIPEKIDSWMPFFIKIKEAYVDRQSQIDWLLDELPI
ncbi:hypothetical protein LPB90_18435 [Chryseobacterium sp. LC2016-29]|uniref:hypothetical protein n=1 Tax=Chryseobacterium sp. LC2016-29 TaxID=2897331 RepID=UPI001E57FA47|nr:hypothetical protein [Chryseobacterium sp. LC2016-29]MCD0480421.1 hypothetical protein [Chryseobacterium sp. LC2016-29]